MKNNINFSQLFESAKAAGEMLQEKASAAGKAAADKTLQSAEKWLEEFPKIESYGLQVVHFSTSLGLNPAVEVQLMGTHADFPLTRLDQILAENKASSLCGMVFGAVKTAYKLYDKVATERKDPLLIGIRLSLSPEISVNIGRPLR